MSTASAVTAAATAERDSTYSVRWLIIGVFVFSDTLNFLDRQLLAAVAPKIKGEFGLSNAEYGWILSAFALVYMVGVPLAGIAVDRFGVRIAMAIGVTVWSLAGVSSGISQSLRGLVASRMGLAVGETVSIPSGSKSIAMYLKPRELGLGIALNSFGFTVGAILAPLIGAFFLSAYGWRSAFLFCGCIGLLWIPLWWAMCRYFPAPAISEPKSTGFWQIAADRRLWRLAAANVFIMTLHTLWFNWTTIYFVDVHHMSLVEANRHFAWIPPVFATLGGFSGGWLGRHLIDRGVSNVEARLRICRVCAPLLLITGVIPFVSSGALAAAVISCSFFLCLALLANLHVIPIHLFGVNHAAFTASVLALSYSLLQLVFSPIVGAMIDHLGFAAVCVFVAPLPLLGFAIVRSVSEQAS